MRPVNKGKCELPVRHVPEVEHIEAKAKGGGLTDWDNLLLSCKYCNTRKGTKAAKGDRGKYLWPDEDDTFHPYQYSSGAPQINEAFLADQDKTYSERAKRLFALVGLGNRPSYKEKDRRFLARNEAYNHALLSKEGWDKVGEGKDKEIYLELMIRLAQSTGFFSSWMEVFKDDEEVKKALIQGFRGTRESVFEKR